MKQEKSPHKLNIHVSERIPASVSWAQTYGQCWNTLMFVGLSLRAHTERISSLLILKDVLFGKKWPDSLLIPTYELVAGNIIIILMIIFKLFQ